MRHFYYPFTVILSALLIFSCNTDEQDAEKLNRLSQERPYFDQKQPSLTPELFAPGSVPVEGRYEYAVSFSPDLKEMYFSGEREGEVQSVFFSKFTDTGWTQPEKVSFSKGEKSNEFEAFVSPDADKLYFAAYDSIFSDEHIWYVDRLEDSWSEAIELDSPINDDLVFYPNAAENGDLYYTSITKGKMYYAPNQDGSFPEVREVEIDFGVHGFISSSQDFLLVDGRKDNDKTKDKDIHVCFKQKDGDWSTPINLGPEVNSDYTETCPSLTPDGKYLFFSRYNEEGGLSNIYWVSAEVIDRVRPADL
ncbi:MAG: PD40 domain-containing protein [Saprospiraceae bacterium]|nr:PD40 domain-containing protein [Saprospiraceae bacterium]